jgi:hypothetical protein
MVWSDYDPSAKESLVKGQPDMKLVELVRTGTQAKGRAKGQPRNEYALSNKLVSDEYGSRPQSFAGVGSRPWNVESGMLWSVDGLVTEVEPSWELPRQKPKEGQAAQWARKAFSFNVSEANRQVAYRKGHMSDMIHDLSGIEKSVSVRGAIEAWEERNKPPMVGPVAPPVSQLAVDLEEADLPAENAQLLLAQAKESAVEAAAARVRREGASGPREQDTAQPRGAKLHECRYPGMECQGCGVEFKVTARKDGSTKGEMMLPAGVGFVHNSQACLELARKKLLDETQKAFEARRMRGQSTLKSQKREAQLAHRFSDSRFEMIATCLDGKCNVEGEARVMCMGMRNEFGERTPCGRGVHAMACCKVSSYHAAVGLFICPICRAKEMNPSSLGTEDTLIRSANRSMLIDLASGASETAKNVADFERLEREWMASMRGPEDESVTTLREPRHSEESFLAFMSWVATDGGRARSFPLIIRMAGIAMAVMEIKNLTSLPRVKKAAKEIATQIGNDPEPCTIPSTLVVKTMIVFVLPQVCSASKFILARSKVLFDGETACGARVGEMTNGGDSHGVLADFSSIAMPVGEADRGMETVNFYIEDSKVGYSRDLTSFGVTKGELALEVAKGLRELWEASKFKVVKEVVDGMILEHPDYQVLRVSLLDMSSEVFKRFTRIVGNSQGDFWDDDRAWILYYAEQRYSSESLPEEDRYVNIAGGPSGCRDLVKAKEWCKRWGFEKFVNDAKGPLLRSTAPGRHDKPTHMPLKSGSTYAHVPKALLKAWEKNVADGVVDNEIDLEGRDQPRFGNHGNRRHSDKKATDSMKVTGVTRGQINDFYGWDQKNRRKISQLHYHGREDRWARARVTMML